METRHLVVTVAGAGAGALVATWLVDGAPGVGVLTALVTVVLLWPRGQRTR